jgi:hypothetical protein
MPSDAIEPPFNSGSDSEAVTLALYAGLHREEALAMIAAHAVAQIWQRPIAVVGGGTHHPEGAALFALFDLTEDHTGQIRRRAIVICEPGSDSTGGSHHA